MKVTICAVGRLRKGPEKDLLDDYLVRFGRTGRAMSLGPANVVEVDDRKCGGKDAEALLLEKSIPDKALRCLLDERGKPLSSPQFSQTLARWRDDGNGEVAFVIGGADGLNDALRAKADFSLSLGAMVWPHMLVRVMLAEQLYRAATILGGGPYHRGN